MSIAFWGAGLMGAPIGRRLAAAGHNLVAYSRTLANAEAIAVAGPNATATTQRNDLNGKDVCITCLALPEHLRNGMLGADGQPGMYDNLPAGAVHIDCSTIAPSLAEELAQVARGRGIGYVQATLSKTPQHAEKGESPIFVGGAKADKEKVWPLLEIMGKPVDVGTIKASCAVKLISNLMGMANVALLGEGMRLGKQAGVDPAQLLALLQETGARSAQMDVRGPMLVEENYGARFALSLAHKDLRLGCEMAKSLGCPVPVMDFVRSVYQQSEERGLGSLDCVAVGKP